MSGLSGISAGVYVLLGAILGSYLINSYQSAYGLVAFLPLSYFELLLVVVPALVLLLPVLTTYFITRRKEHKNNEKI